MIKLHIWRRSALQLSMGLINKSGKLTCSGMASLIGMRVQSKFGVDDGPIVNWLLNQSISVKVETAGQVPAESLRE